MELICIVCPKGCGLQVDTSTDREITVSGNQCKRGQEYAVMELTNPVRTVCSTVKTAFSQTPVLPVRTSAEVPKGRIMDVMREINVITLDRCVSCGDIIIENILGLNVNIIATSSILEFT